MKRKVMERGREEGSVFIDQTPGRNDEASVSTTDEADTDSDAVSVEKEASVSARDEGDTDSDADSVEKETSVSARDEADTDSDAGSVEKEGKGSPRASAYSRAFSKIFTTNSASSDMGPVLSARKPLVAKKLDEEAGDHRAKTVAKKEKKQLREKSHLFPQSHTDAKERDLIKLATRGVVKLFNAVSKAQKVQIGADSWDAKVVAKKSKAAFLSELRGPAGAQGLEGTTQRDAGSHWSVLQDEFMLGRSKLKDWDKEQKEEVEQI